jgi:hypothetical protein
MMRNNLIFILFLAIVLSACIKNYEPEFKDDSIEKWVIEGSISNLKGWQEVRISKSSSYSSALFNTVENAQVQIVDELGQIFQMENAGGGLYRVWMTEEYLIPGRSYYIEVTTSDGNQFESIPDVMPTETHLDEAYYELKDMPTTDPEVFIRGLQFYVDLDALEESNQYYRWRITETWEFESAYPKEFWYDGEVHQNIPPDSSTFCCWTTRTYDQIFTLSTELLQENQAHRIPLQFVSSENERLSILYSFLIEQIALSETTFTYWKQLGENVNVGEGLYASQPLAIKGNIRNVNEPDQSVLGNFQAVNISSKRYFVEPIPGLELNYSNKCSPAFLRKGLREIYPWEYPAYLMTGNMNQWIPFILNNECVDCTLRGGKTVKPDFWPW